MCGQFTLGQTTAHSGGSQTWWQVAVLIGRQAVSQRGGAHTFSHGSSHVSEPGGRTHFHWQRGPPSQPEVPVGATGSAILVVMGFPEDDAWLPLPVMALPWVTMPSIEGEAINLNGCLPTPMVKFCRACNKDSTTWNSLDDDEGVASFSVRKLVAISLAVEYV